jgi:hypothetical protein
MLPAYLSIALASSIGLNFIAMFTIIALRRSHAHAYRAAACRKCGYDTRATIDHRCPECGEPVRTPADQPHLVTHCDFCGKSNRETGPHVEGPAGAYICAACVELCHAVVVKNRRRAASVSQAC